MSYESLAEKAVSTVAAIADLKRMLADVNDYGEPTGYCQECHDLENDAGEFLGTLRRRAFTLKRRFECNQPKSNESVHTPRT